MAKGSICIGVTIGDINGIGPEVALKAVRHFRPANARFILIGSRPVLARQARALGLAVPPAWNPSVTSASPRVAIWDPGRLSGLTWRPGRIDRAAGRAAANWIRAGVKACGDGILQGIVTAPISKDAFHRAGLPYPGHTEMLAELTGARRYAMMLFGGPLKVVLATRHVPLAQVSRKLTRSGILEAIELTGQALPWLGARRARIGVCALNPHAGDGGLLGNEEARFVEPAIREAKRAGYIVEGPIPADVVFYRARRGDFDAVIAMYHDQGLGPLKMLAFDRGVNVTLGLPIVRTSPDHGTAFDIAGRNRADPASMMEALRWACRLARRRNPWSVSGSKE